MPFVQSEGVRYFYFHSFKNDQLCQAIFTRHGGCSPSPWKSLNMGGTVGDDPERVNQNVRIAFKAIDRDLFSIYDVWQVHGSDVVRVDHPRETGTPHMKADAMITNKVGVTLFMRFADCVPVFLYDPIKNVIGLVHSGWKGTIGKITAKTIRMMSKWYGCMPENILAGIGPSISANQYEVGPEVEQQVLKSFGRNSKILIQKENGKVKLDLQEANRILLVHSGVNKIEMTNICTASSLHDWYSHRGESGRTGRFGAIIGLEEEL